MLKNCKCAPHNDKCHVPLVYDSTYPKHHYLPHPPQSEDPSKGTERGPLKRTSILLIQARSGDPSKDINPPHSTPERGPLKRTSILLIQTQGIIVAGRLLKRTVTLPLTYQPNLLKRTPKHLTRWPSTLHRQSANICSIIQHPISCYYMF